MGFVLLGEFMKIYKESLISHSEIILRNMVRSELEQLCCHDRVCVHLYNKVWDKVRGQIQNQVWDQVWGPISDKTNYQIRRKTNEYI